MSWLSAAWHWYAAESYNGTVVYPHAGLVNPVVAGIGAALLIGAALQQAATARRRHKEQTDADRQRRITESFSKATEQLGNDKTEVRLGGIYTLERISRESSDDYWTIMETLCAFVRERARPSEQDTTSLETVARFYEKAGQKRVAPPTDVAAVLAVIVRRDKKNYQRESDEGWRLNFRGTDLSKANLRRANLIGANLSEADLSEANLSGADLIGASLIEANLSGAYLMEAYLDEANLIGANLGWAYLNEANLIGAKLDRANLSRAYLYGANLSGASLIEADLIGAKLAKANLSGASLSGADLIGANLSGANLVRADLDGADLSKTVGDAETQLPEGTPRPEQWPSA